MWADPISLRADRLKTALLAAFGGTTSGISVLGVAHGVCHAACQGVVAAAALVGISLVGMPLGFLLDPRWALGFAAMGTASAGAGLYLRLREQRALSRGVVWFGAIGLLSLATLATGLWQLTHAQTSDAGAGVAAIVPPRIEVDAARKAARVGAVDAESEYLGIDNGAMRFRIALNTSDMAAPPLDASSVGTTIYVQIAARRVAASTWAVQDTGHMGHHLRAVATFQLDAALADALVEARRVELGFATARDGADYRFTWTVRRSQ